MHSKKCVVFLKVCLQCIKIYYTIFTVHSNTKKYTINHSIVQECFHNQGTFPQSRKFSTFNELFHSHENFKKNKEFFHNQIIFPQSRNISAVVKISHKQGNFQQTKFATNFFPSSNNFSTNKDSYTVKKIFCKQRSKRFFKKVKILEPFNTKSYSKNFLNH